MDHREIRSLIKGMLPSYPQGRALRFQSLKGNGVCWAVRNPSKGIGMAGMLQKDSYRVHVYDDGRVEVDLATGGDYLSNQKRLRRIQERIRDRKE